MRSRIGAGIVAGLIAGVVFGVQMQMMMVRTPEGMEVPMMGMVAMILKSRSLLVGWLYHLFNSAVIGGLFGWLFGAIARTYGSGLTWGALWGLVWWVLGGQTLMPILLGQPPFPVLMPEMRGMAFGSLVGHLIYGLILGGAFAWLVSPAVAPPRLPVEQGGSPARQA